MNGKEKLNFKELYLTATCINALTTYRFGLTVCNGRCRTFLIDADFQLFFVNLRQGEAAVTFLFYR